jgi:cellulose synthase/poly-beta-1,6-N-acetylglucosamine synthase-like glycosyltransferase
MKWVFWLSLVLVGYSYLGYPAWLWLRGRIRPRPVRTGPYDGSITVVMVVRNESSVLEAKVRNLIHLNHSADRPEIIVVSDGSIDRTNQILSGLEATGNLRAIYRQEPRGKAAGLNEAMRAAHGEVVVFMDARQEIEPDAVRLLAENFADPAVGCASGELILGNLGAQEHDAGMGLYWKVEKVIRQMESFSGSVVGATGALYAVRRSLLVSVPEETILDDVFIPMHVLRQGARVVFDSRARAWDVADQGREREFSRKVRTLTGNYQLLQLAPWLLTSSNPVRFEFVSHKLTRLFVPFALIAVLLASLVIPGAFYRSALGLQLLFYGSAVWALLFPRKGPFGKVADAALSFILLNAAAVVAFSNFVARRNVVWAR